MFPSRKIHFLSLLFVTFLFPWKSQSQPSSSPAFRFHLVNEPSSLKPWEQKTSAAGYLLSQISSGLLAYQDQKLAGNLAEKCEYKTPTKIRCQLKPNLKWSDSTPLTAVDFVRSFQAFLDPQNHAFRANLLFPLKNAEKYFSAKASKDSLGAKAVSDRILELELEKPDSEFIYVLSNPLLAPLPSTPISELEAIRKDPRLWKSSGPYLITSWEAQKKIELKPNPEFWKKNSRPNIEIRTVAEDSIALNLYEKGELSFLRRLPTLFISKYRGRPDYFELDQFRFDYLGFSPRWKGATDLRQALAKSLNYPDLQKLFQAKGTPGCPGIPQSQISGDPFCLKMDQAQAQSLWKKLSPKPRSLELIYSRQGGDDHKRSMEWFQSEWKKSLGLSVEVTSLENKIFTDRLAQNPPDIFRKGLAPERPTCLSALENFHSNHPENYIRYSSQEFDRVLEQMRTSSQETEKKKLCQRGLRLLLEEAWIIPTGPIHFTVLASANWKGWKLNELNQLDLSDLQYIEKPASTP